MDQFLVVHYNELGLKKGNRDYFENRLCRHIRAVLQDCGGGYVRRLSGRLLVELRSDADLDEVYRRMKNVFGVAYFARAQQSSADLDQLEQNAWAQVQDRPFESFRVDARRADKGYPLTSVEINQRVGAYIQERSKARVDLNHAKLTCWIEVMSRNDALIYNHRVEGPGGLPSSTGGKVVVLLSGGIDSPVAA